MTTRNTPRLIGPSQRRLFVLAMVAVTLLLGPALPASAQEAQLISSLSALQSHVEGTATLSGSEIAAHKLIIDTNKDIFGDTAGAITASFNYVQAYEQNVGPMWSAGSPTENGYSRRETSDEDINWTTFNVMQYIVDDTYNSTNVATRQNLLNGYKFDSADVFPGYVVPPANPNTTHTVSIDGSFLNTYGRNTMHWTPEMDDPPRQESAARKATGTYLAPGSIATITVPSSIVDQGYVVRVGGNSWDLSNKDPVDRLDRVSLTYAIDSTSIEVASPLGGNIYIDVPFEASAGVVDIDIKNVVRSPFFSAQDHHTTTLSEWRNTERNHLAPWADFQSEKFNLHVPTGWIFALDDPVTLMENWDKAIDVCNDLFGFPRDRGKETLFDQVDVRIRAGAYAPGYPSVNNTYDPLRNNDASDYNTLGTAYTGNHGSYLVQGPSPNSEVEFHELGHAYLFPKLPGEVEVAIALPHVAVFNQAFGYDLDFAFRTACRGFVNNPHRSLDNTAVAWMTSFNFFTRKLPMHQLEKQYQLKGHAKFVEVARVFGWDVLGNYYRSFNEDYEALGYTPSYDTDDHLLRLSEAAGGDITPLFHFYGVHPLNLLSLQDEMKAAGIGKSREVYELLKHYKALVPENNAAFRQFARDWWDKDEPSLDGYWTEHEHARQWDETDLSDIPYNQAEGGFYVPSQLPNGEMYTENSADLIRGVIDDLLLLYFPEFVADLDGDETLDAADWLIFISHAHMDMTGLTPEEALAFGDLDGDLDNDLDDFTIFRQAYELVYPQQGAFGEMVAGATVPEPGTLALLACGFAALCRRRRQVRNA